MNKLDYLRFGLGVLLGAGIVIGIAYIALSQLGFL